MKRMDSAAINDCSIPSLILMEYAAKSVCDYIVENLPFACASRALGVGASFKSQSCESVAIIAGKGNNGADGFCLARQLSHVGFEPVVFLIGSPEDLSEEGSIHYRSLLALGVSVYQILSSDSVRASLTDDVGINGLVAKCLNQENGNKLNGGRNDEVKEIHVGEQENSNISCALFETLLSRCDVIVDAIFGISLNRKVAGVYKEVIDIINGLREEKRADAQSMTPVKRSPYVIALDVPSGVETDTGKVLGVAVKADVTITFAYPKIGLYTLPGAKYAGKVLVRDIGIPRFLEQEILGVKLPAYYSFGSFFKGERTGVKHKMDSEVVEKNLIVPQIEKEKGASVDEHGLSDKKKFNSCEVVRTINEECFSLLPPRETYGHKGTFGSLLVVAGSADMGGAAMLCAKAAYRSGVGLVYVLTHRDNRSAMLSYVPEAVVYVYDDDTTTKEFQRILTEISDRVSAVVVGSGLSKSDVAKRVLKEVIAVRKPLLVDADGLNILSEDTKLLKQVSERKNRTVFTPHIGEVERLSGKSKREIGEDIVNFARGYSALNNVTLCLKNAHTVVAFESGDVYINTVANSGMATAGSGDVLAGIIGANLAMYAAEFARSEACFEQTVLKGVYMHSMAGLKARDIRSEVAMIASDILNNL